MTVMLTLTGSLAAQMLRFFHELVLKTYLTIRMLLLSMLAITHPSSTIASTVPVLH
jgi:hypothetical protein